MISPPFTDRPSTPFCLASFLVVIAVAGSCVAMHGRMVQNQRTAVAQIEQLGGTVQYSFEMKQYGNVWIADSSAEMIVPGWLVSLLGKDAFYCVCEIEFYYGPADINKVLEPLQALPGVRRLTLNHQIPADVREDLMQTNPEMTVDYFSCVW